MKRKDVILMVRKAGFEPEKGTERTNDMFILFAKLIAEKERDECAKLCEKITFMADGDVFAKHIRAMGKQ